MNGSIGERFLEDVHGDIQRFRATRASVSDTSEALNDRVNPIGVTDLQADRDDAALATLGAVERARMRRHRCGPLSAKV